MNGDSLLLTLLLNLRGHLDPGSWQLQRNPGQTVLLSFKRLNILNQAHVLRQRGEEYALCIWHLLFHEVCLLLLGCLPLTFLASPWGRNYIPHCTGNKAGAQRSSVIFPQSHSLESPLLVFEPRAIWLQSPSCIHFIVTVLTWQDQGRCCSMGLRGLHQHQATSAWV